ncbi:MAG: FAD:protein FMN transferase [Proteobacteria bacterium]|nr:FAD:protein FMN transferase [Pseudomonadota bacterium]
MKKLTKDSLSCDRTRRSFIKLCGLLGAGAAAVAVLPSERAEALLFGKREYKVSDTRLMMGSFLSITAIHSSRDQAEHAIGLAFDEIKRLSAIFSRHDVGTPVAQLNTTGKLVNAPAELLDVVTRSLQYHQLTNGSFDITTQPVVDLFKQRFAAGLTPSDTEITDLVSRVGSKHLRMDNGSITLDREGMGITLDGIAPGYICDRVSTLLSQLGVTNHLINASGDIRTSGTSLKGKPWTVAIQDPNHQKAYPGVITMSNGAISTSGNYEIYYDQEKMFHHIITPTTGRSPILTTSVTTTAATLMDADALATGLMVLAPEESVHLLGNQPQFQCFIIGRDNKTTHSPGWATSLA